MVDLNEVTRDDCCNQSHSSEPNQHRQSNPNMVVAIHQKSSRLKTGHSLQLALVDRLRTSHDLV